MGRLIYQRMHEYLLLLTKFWVGGSRFLLEKKDEKRLVLHQPPGGIQMHEKFNPSHTIESIASLPFVELHRISDIPLCNRMTPSAPASFIAPFRIPCCTNQNAH